MVNLKSSTKAVSYYCPWNFNLKKKSWYSLESKLFFLSTVFLTSIGFLTLTFILYALINELKSSVHGRCALGFLISIILAGLCAFPIPFHVKQFIDFWIINDTSLYYELAKVFRVFAFIWINMMIFDVWWILR